MDEEKRFDDKNNDNIESSQKIFSENISDDEAFDQGIIEEADETENDGYNDAVSEIPEYESGYVEVKEETQLMDDGNMPKSSEHSAHLPYDELFAEERENVFVPEVNEETNIFSEYEEKAEERELTAEEKRALYNSMPKRKHGFLRAIGIIAAACAFVMLVIVIATSFFVPEPVYEVAEPDTTNESEILPKESNSVLIPEQRDGNDIMPEFGGEAPVITNLYNPVVEIVEQAMPSLVTIKIDKTTTGDDGKELITGWTKGSGFIVSTDGYILTNYHVIQEGGNIKVCLSDGNEYLAKYIGGDEIIDLAVLKIEGNDFKPVALGSSAETKAGEIAIVIGSPAGLDDQLINSVTVGYISAVQREIQFNGYKQKFLQTDAAVNSGNSGGPLFNQNGEVIGIVTLKSLVSGFDEAGNPVDSEGLGFAMPIDTALSAIKEIFEKGAVERPGIGIYFRFYDDNAAALTETLMGMHIEQIVENGPADKVGIKVGDVVTHCNGIEIVTGQEVSEALASRKIGDTIVLTVNRDGQIIDFSVTIADLNAIE